MAWDARVAADDGPPCGHIPECQMSPLIESWSCCYCDLPGPEEPEEAQGLPHRVVPGGTSFLPHPFHFEQQIGVMGRRGTLAGVTEVCGYIGWGH